MNCVKCKKELVEDYAFCPFCGKKQQTQRSRKPKRSPNGTGCAYQRPGQKTWTASVVIGWRPLPPYNPGNPANQRQRIPIKRTKAGFRTKVDALAYCKQLKTAQATETRTLMAVFEAWGPWYAPRVDKHTFACYKAAFAHFSAIHDMDIAAINAGDLQKCLDECPAGHRTHQNMKVTAGLIWKYALDRDYVAKNVAANLYVGKGQSVKREPLTDLEVEKIRQEIPNDPYAAYIYALVYLGFRPGELLEIRKDQVYANDAGRLFVVEGKKTEAGRGRTVPVHRNIEQIIRTQLATEGTELLFPMIVMSRSGEFQGYRQMRDDYFNKFVFRPLADRLGIPSNKVPYSARHSFSDKLKKADGDSMDKARLIGHSDYHFTQDKYQSTSEDDLAAIMDTIV